MDIAAVSSPIPQQTPTGISPGAGSRDPMVALCGPSPAMERLWTQIRTVAPYFRVILLEGETGCAAESVAEALHSLSPFRKGPLVTLTPAEAPRRLRNPRRLLQESAGGVLYLSEANQLSPEAQADLQRFLRLNRLHLVGIVAFSAGPLRSLVSAGTFSAELALSLGSFSLNVPALRQRPEDIALLAQSFLQEACADLGRPVPALSPGWIEAATGHAWSGNLTQLRAVMALAAEDGEDPLAAHDFDGALNRHTAIRDGNGESATVRMIALDQVVREHIRSVLIGCKGNKLRASEVLGISRSTLYRMLQSGPTALAIFN